MTVPAGGVDPTVGFVVMPSSVGSALGVAFGSTVGGITGVTVIKPPGCVPIGVTVGGSCGIIGVAVGGLTVDSGTKMVEPAITLAMGKQLAATIADATLASPPARAASVSRLRTV
jgi:hypothetical protein